MRKCGCGKVVRSDDTNAVRVYDRRGQKVVKVICGECAVNSYVKNKRTEQFGGGHKRFQPFFGQREFRDPEESLTD